MKIETDSSTLWSAWNAEDDPDETRLTGHGRTEREAINNLVEQLVERAFEQGCHVKREP